MKIATVIVLIMLMTLVACTGVLSSPAAAQPSQTPSADAHGPVASSPVPVKSQPGADGSVIVLKRSGGFAGKTEEWTIFADGRISSSGTQNAQVSSEQLAALLQTIDQLGFYSMQSSYMPRDTCCDRFTYDLTVTSGDKSNQVTYLEGASEVPANLLKATDAVLLLVSGAAK